MRKIFFIFAALIACFYTTLVFADNIKGCSIVNDDTIQAKNYDHLLGTLNGISDEVLKQHFELYRGYVKSTNEIDTKIKDKNLKGNASFSDYRSLASARAFPHNGVVLHELYFENLNGKKTSPSNELNKALIQSFGSYDNYIAELKEAAKSARSGWVYTGFDKRSNKIKNFVIDLHDEHMPALVEPLLVFDVWEHAYMADYGIDKASYINAFIKNIDWDVVSKRFESNK